MKNLIILLLFSIFSVTAQETEKAQNFFLENLIALEKVSNNENEVIDLNTLYESRDFLLRITGIKYELEKPFDMPIFPPKEILKAWRKWYETNKEKLYWDRKTDTVKVLKN